MMHGRNACAALLLSLTAGCTVGPDFVRPEPAAPPAWATQPEVPSRAQLGGEIDRAWWTRFGDPVLDGLVARLAAENLDLQAAAERVAQARALRSVAGAAGRPQLDVAAEYERKRESPNGLSSATVHPPGTKPEFDLYGTSATAGWELDLFGRVRRGVEAADADAAAAVEGRRAIGLAVIADLAENYLRLRTAQAQEEVVRRNLDLAERRAKLERVRLEEAMSSELSVAEFEARASTIATDLPRLVAQRSEAINAIGLLLGLPPRALQVMLTPVRPLPVLPDAVPVGLPGDLLRRRPDVLEAEARLHAATARTGVAVASFYPSISLNGVFGVESLHAGSLFDWASRILSVGPTVNMPIFSGGRLRGTLALRTAEQREAAISYRRTVVAAWNEVDDGLTDYAQAQRQAMLAEAARSRTARALGLSEVRHREGVVATLDIVVEEAGLVAADRGVIDARAQAALKLVALYKALGGGFGDGAEGRGGIRGNPAASR